MKVIILAGGLGTRLSEETVLKPKPMVEIGNMPILWHIMKTYAMYEYKDFVIALGYKGYVIKEFFLNYRLHKSNLTLNIRSGNAIFRGGDTEDWNIELIDTGEGSMTGGRLLNLKHLFNPGDTFMLTYGDGVSNVDIDKLLAFHKSHGKIATLTAVRPPARFGSLEINEFSEISEFMEKPQIGEGWINGGYFVFNYEVFDYLSNDQTILEREPLENLCMKKQLMAFRHDGFWQCMDTIRDKENLNYIWQQDKAPWKKW